MIQRPTVLALLCLMMIDSFAFADLPPQAVEAYERGKKAIEFGDLDAGILSLSKAISLAPQWAVPYFTRAGVWYKKQDYKKASEDYTSVIRLEPGASGAYTMRAAAFLDIGEITKALDDVTKALSLDEKKSDAYMVRGTIFFKQGDFAKVYSISTKQSVWMPVTFPHSVIGRKFFSQ